MLAQIIHNRLMWNMSWCWLCGRFEQLCEIFRICYWF